MNKKKKVLPYSTQEENNQQLQNQLHCVKVSLKLSLFMGAGS